MDAQKKIIISLIVLSLILVGLLFAQLSTAQTNKKMYNQLNAELQTERNEKGQQEARIRVIEAERKAAFLQVQTKDTVIKWLQDVVKDYNGKLSTGTVLVNNTTTEGAVKTIVIRDTLIRETIGGERIVMLQDNYTANWSNEWEEGQIVATPDSVYRNIKVKNKYEITLGKKRNGWFKPRVQEVKVVNLNPNTVTKELRTFAVKSKPKRLSLGLQVGYGLDLTTLKPRPYLGAGLQFNLLAIK